MDECQFKNIKDSMADTGQVPESIYFFYGGESQAFVDALEFIGLSPINRDLVHFCSPTFVDRP